MDECAHEAGVVLVPIIFVCESMRIPFNKDGCRTP